MRRVTNTTKEVRETPLIGLFATMAGGIEASEAQGQRELVESTQLPTNCRDKAVLEAAGVKFGKVCDGDPLFCDAELPKGWQKKATDHSMWSELVDEAGKVRARIFYKAAFYDRDAFMSPV